MSIIVDGLMVYDDENKIDDIGLISKPLPQLPRDVTTSEAESAPTYPPGLIPAARTCSPGTRDAASVVISPPRHSFDGPSSVLFSSLGSVV